MWLRSPRMKARRWPTYSPRHAASAGAQARAGRARLIYLPDAAFPAAFAQNASKEELAVLAAVQRPLSPACITVTVPRPLGRIGRPGSWLPTDRMIVEDNHRFMAERMKASSFPSCRSHADRDRALRCR